MSKSRIPKFYFVRIYLFSVILYYFLVFPYIGLLFWKIIPDIGRQSDAHWSAVVQQDKGEDSDELLSATTNFHDTIVSPSFEDSVSAKDKIGANAKKYQFGIISSFLFNLFIWGLVLGFVYSLPFKIYFRRKKKGKYISPQLKKFCKQQLYYSPYVISGIFVLIFLLFGFYVFYIVNKGDINDSLDDYVLKNYLYISLVAGLLIILFVFFWIKYRVQIKYINHVFENFELKKLLLNYRKGKIRNRLWVSSVMTTFLPFTVVITYLMFSVTHIEQLLPLTEEVGKLIVGRQIEIMGSEAVFQKGGMYSNMYYITGFDSMIMFFGIISSTLVSFVYIFFFVRWTTAAIVRPVNELLVNMLKMGETGKAHYSVVRTTDEIGQLTEGYNQMADQIQDYIANISGMNDAYYRFVPKQFLDFLGKKSVVDVCLGDQVQKEMTVLFSDIRSFTEISESMTPKENFDFINHYLGIMEPVIRKHNGIVDKFMGDSIMALFSENPGDALEAALEIRQKLKQFNQIRDLKGLPEVDCGIGIHTGNLMMGIIGGEGRMESTVISDAVNLASRLEGLTKLYHTSIIISEDTLIKLQDPSKYHYRFLDIAKVKGKKKAVYIFEIMDGEPVGLRELKIKTKDIFVKAVDLYRNKNFQKANDLFTELNTVNPDDFAVALYKERCERMLEKGIPEDWDGISVINVK